MQQDVSVYHVIRGTLILVVAVALVGWFFIRALKRSEDPAQLIFRWIITLLVVGTALYLARGPVSLALIPIALTVAVIMIFVWRGTIAALFAKPFTALYDGGQTEIEPRPYYSIAEGQRKRGHYTEAIAHIRRQLEKFPGDFQGQMMLAEIQAENLNDLQGAELTINRLCGQRGHASRNVVLALNTLADWHLKFSQDRDAAQQALEKIIALQPNTEFAMLASQRIAHLASKERLLESYDRPRIAVPEGIKNIGLLQSSAHLAPEGGNPVELAAKYVAHLEQHPFDTEAREKLAIIYADHYERLDLAEDQLDQLIELTNQPAKSVVHWLNLLADLQVKHGANYDAVCETLERIVERFPDHAAADQARSRINLVKLELKGQEQNQAVKMGTYEQNIGLKRGVPKQY